MSAVYVLLIVLGAGCAGGLQVPVRGERPFLKPGAVIRAAYMAAAQGLYEEAQGHIGERDRSEASRGGISVAEWWDWTTRGRSLRRVEIVEERYQGEAEAIVAFRMHFGDGSVRLDDTRLYLEDGHWRISLLRIISFGPVRTSLSST